QRSGPELPRTLVAPARQAILDDRARERAREVLRDLCDAVDLPSTQARALIEDVASGRLFVGSDAYLPAYRPLEPLFARLPADALLLVEDPPRVVTAWRDEERRARAAWAARRAQPHFRYEDHYLTAEELERSLSQRTVLACHRSIVASSQAPTLLAALEAGPPGAPSLAATDQRELALRLERARQSGGRNAGLSPLVEQLEAWRQDGYDVTLTARVATQAD